MAATGGYTLDLAYKPRVGAEYTFASVSHKSRYLRLSFVTLA